MTTHQGCRKVGERPVSTGWFLAIEQNTVRLTPDTRRESSGLDIARPKVRPLNVATFRQNVSLFSFRSHSGEVQLRLNSGRVR